MIKWFNIGLGSVKKSKKKKKRLWQDVNAINYIENVCVYIDIYIAWQATSVVFMSVHNETAAHFM